VSFREFDVVRIVRLATPSREYDGSDASRRAPQIGDTGTVVHVLAPGDPRTPYVVECVREDGYTIWVAEFSADELELRGGPE
jgi:hypothetical protein